MPDEKPSSSIARTLGSRMLRSTSRQPGRAGGAALSTSGVVVIVHQVRRVVAELRLRVDRAGSQALAHGRRHDLVVDAPPDVLLAHAEALAPPRVVLPVRMQAAVGVDPAALL